jgi:oxygen-independent coproporphyrinogen-3 oxidase
MAPLHTIFLGGGTPTLLPDAILEELLLFLTTKLPLHENYELSIECNPETLTPEKIKILGQYISRISLGVQAFTPLLRKRLQRCGSIDNLAENLIQLREAGITNIGFDLIYGIPGETVSLWKNELYTALQLEPSHISAYSLTVEEGCKLSNHLQIGSDTIDLSADMWSKTKEVLESNGLMQYEISNYASRDKECLHNQNIWHAETYLGVGPAACSFDGEKRWCEPCNLNKWLRDTPKEFDIIEPDKRVLELLIMGLRTTRGWREVEFKHITQTSLTQFTQSFITLEKMGLLYFDKNQCVPTSKGLLFWDTIAETLWQ